MIDPGTLQLAGNALRSGVEAVAEQIGHDKLPPAWQYMWAAANNLLVALEKDSGVQGGYFGSTGVVINVPGVPAV